MKKLLAVAVLGCGALLAPEHGLGQCTDHMYDFSAYRPSLTYPVRIPNRIVNLTSPWAFPQRSWPNFGTAAGARGAYDLGDSVSKITALRALINKDFRPGGAGTDADRDSIINSDQAYDYYSAFSLGLPQWERERQLIRDQIDYLMSFKFDTFRLLCRRPLAHVQFTKSIIPSPTTSDYNTFVKPAWDGIVETAQYIRSKGGKVILCFDLEDPPTPCGQTGACTWSFGASDSASQVYYNYIPDTFFKTGPTELADTVLYYEIGNEFDQTYLVGNLPSTVTESDPAAVLTFYDSSRSARGAVFQSVYQAAINKLAARATGTGGFMTKAALGAKLSAGTGTITGAYIVNRLTFTFNGSSTYRFPILSAHAYSGSSEVQHDIQWIRTKTDIPDVPLYFGEIGYEYKYYDSLLDTNPAQVFTSTAEEDQEAFITSTFWESISNYAINSTSGEGFRNKVTGSGLWASCDMNMHYDDPDETDNPATTAVVERDDTFRTEFIWGLLEVALDADVNHPTPSDPCTRTFKLYHRKALEELWRQLYAAP